MSLVPLAGGIIVSEFVPAEKTFRGEDGYIRNPSPIMPATAEITIACLRVFLRLAVTWLLLLLLLLFFLFRLVPLLMLLTLFGAFSCDVFTVAALNDFGSWTCELEEGKRNRIYHSNPAAITKKWAAKNNADSQSCSTREVRTISANQLSEIA